MKIFLSIYEVGFSPTRGKNFYFSVLALISFRRWGGSFGVPARVLSLSISIFLFCNRMNATDWDASPFLNLWAMKVCWGNPRLLREKEREGDKRFRRQKTLINFLISLSFVFDLIHSSCFRKGKIKKMNNRILKTLALPTQQSF